MKFKFTDAWFNNESDGILKHFDQLNLDDVYEVLKWDNTQPEIGNGATYIRNTRTKEEFDIDEIPHHELDSTWWCFIINDPDYADEFEEIV